MPSFLTTVQAAELLHVSPRSVRRAIADGTLPVARIGRSVRIPLESVERLVVKGA